MSEIEKAREFLDSRWNKHIGGLFGQASEITAATENLIVAAMTEYGNRIREIAREEIEAALEPMPKVYVVKTTPINQEGGDRNQLDRRPDREDKSPPAVEAPTAGDTTALARRLAEALHASFSWGWVGDTSVDQQIVDALTEARKAGLIE